MSGGEATGGDWLMALTAIQRRVGRLESVFVVDRLPGYPPLTADDIEALAERMAEGQTWTEEETARVIRQCPIIQGELIVKAHKGEVIIKRYLGVDLAWV
jgi:hypothetical protein